MSDKRFPLNSTRNASSDTCQDLQLARSPRKWGMHPRMRSRGMVIYYMAAAMVFLCGICSLAVDLGRVQVTKSELRRTADASARAAVSALPDYAAGINLAIQYGSSNSADGQPVVLSATEDIEFGVWSSKTGQFSVLSGSARANANAVRITARRIAARNNATPLLFGKVLGAATCDTSASAIAMLAPARAMNIVGINGVTMNGNDRIDSYNSSSGTYSSATASDQVSVASNGAISLVGSSQIRGDAFYGGSAAPTGPITGTIQKLEQALQYDPPKLPATYTSWGAVTLKGGQSLTLTAGNHYFTSLSMSGSTQLAVTGPVKLYVQNSFAMDGNSSIAVAGNLPANLEIYILGNSPVSLSQNDLFAILYAPQSTLSMNGNADLFGSVIASRIQMNGNNSIHYDESLNGNLGPPKIVLVK